MRNREGVNVDSSQTNKEKAHSTDEFGPNTYMAMIQDHQADHLAKAVPRRPSQGTTRCGRTRTGTPQDHLHRGGALMVGEVSCGGAFQNYLSKQTSTHYKREGGAPHFIINTQEGKREEELHSYLGFS